MRLESWLLLAGCLGANACASAGKTPDPEPGGAAVSPPAPVAGVNQTPVDNARAILSGWPLDSQNAANAMLDRHGAPDIVTDAMFVWMSRGEFTNIIAFRNPTKHLFPVEHDDVLLHETRLKVPLKKVGELAKFDGSIVVNRTRGTISAHCDTERRNILALNIASDVAAGRRSAESARRFMAQTTALALAGKESPYAQKLQVAPPLETGDPDAPMPLPEVEPGQKPQP